MMKKSLLYSAAVLATWGMTSCSNEVLDDGLQPQPTSQVIELAVENAGSGLGARVGRPLLSSEADQNIDNVYVFVVQTLNGTDSIVAAQQVTGWNNADTKSVISYNDASGHGRKTRIELKGTEGFEKKDQATYAIYAIGCSQGSAFKVNVDESTKTDINVYLSGLVTEKNNKANNDKALKSILENVVLTNGEGTSTTADEFFAGKATIQFTKGTKNKFSQGITLHRQVAGVFTYVKNVPFMLDSKGNTCKTLQLVASNPNKDIVLGMFYDKTLGQNGSTTIKGETPDKDVIIKNKLKNVVNGTSSLTTNKVISTIDLTQWFSKLQDVNNDGVLDRYEYKNEDGVLVEDTANQIWINPTRQQDGSAAATFVKGSVFSGEFIIPFQKNETQTFALELLSNDKSEVVRSWNINLPENDWVKETDFLNIWDSINKWTTPAGKYSDSKNNYSVLRNHLYGVGTKVSANPSPQPNPNPGPGEPNPKPVPDPEEPTPDVEDPQNLNTKQDILLQVNDNWEVIHKMEVE